MTVKKVSGKKKLKNGKKDEKQETDTNALLEATDEAMIWMCLREASFFPFVFFFPFFFFVRWGESRHAW